MSKPQPLELELERLAGKTPRTSSLWKKTNDDCTLPAGRMLGPCPPPPGPNRLRPPAPARSPGLGACPPGRGLAGAEPVAAPGSRPVAGAGACPPRPAVHRRLGRVPGGRVVESLRNAATVRNLVKNRKQERN